MGKDSAIQWTSHTYNPWRGCTKVSPGCASCYAEALSNRNPAVLGKWGPNGTRVVASESKWREPLAWDKAAKAAGERHRVFCASLADVFEDWDGPMVDSRGRILHYNSAATWWVSDETMHGPITMDFVRRRLFSLIEQTPNLDWLVLTKRPENINSAFAAQPNVWLGASVENQEQADARIPLLAPLPAAVRFLSMEPLLGPVDLIDMLGTIRERSITVPSGMGPNITRRVVAPPKIDWVIVGGESGPKARPFSVGHARSIIYQCRNAGVACFIKQLGADPIECEPDTGPEWPVPLEHDNRGNIVPILRDSHGGDWDEWPADLKVRQFPILEAAR